MSTRTNLRPNPVLVNGSMAGDLTSAPTVLQSLTIGSYGYTWSGTTPVGTIEVQVSNNYSLNENGTVKNAGDWVTMPVVYNGSTVTTVPLTGNTGAGMIDWSTGAYAIRTVYTSTSGTGTLNIIINGKVA